MRHGLLRIGLIAYAFERPTPPSFASYTLEMARAIAEAGGSDVEIVLLTTAREAAQHLPTYFPTYTLPGCRWLPGLLTAGNVAVVAAARRLGLDIIHDPTGASPFLFRRGNGWLAVTTVHDLVSFVYPETHTPLTNFMYRVWLPRAIRRATAVITVSYHSKGDITRFLGVDGDKVAVVPCGVGPDFTPQAQDGEAARLAERYGVRPPYVLYLGGVGARKNVPGLLEAYAQLRGSHPEYTLVVAGARIWKSEVVYEAVERLGLVPYVVFTGYAADEDLPALHRQAELLAFPSLYEGFGRPPLEAMACGTPVVTANTSSLPEVTGDAALLVDPHDTGALAAAMERVLADADLRQAMVEKGLARAARFTWARAGREVVALYRRLLEEKT